MFKKFSAIAAFVALILSGVTPAVAAPNANSQSRTWMYSDNSFGLTDNSNTTWTFSVTPNANRVQATVDLYLSSSLATASIGKVFEASLRLKKPNGEVYVGGSPSSVLFHGNTYPNQPYTIVEQNAQIRAYLRYDTTASAVITGGTWTAEVVATLDGQPIVFDGTNAYLRGNNFWAYGDGLIQTMPGTASSFEYASATCVDTSLVAPGDRLEFGSTFTNNGSTTTQNYGINTYTVSTDNYVSQSYDSINYLTWTDSHEATGIYAERSGYSNQTAATSGYVDISITNATTSTEVSVSCAPPSPSTPSLLISSLYYGEIQIPEVAGASRYAYEVIKVSDNSIVSTGSLWTQYETPVNGVFTENVYATFQQGQSYKARLRTENAVTKSEWSSFSESVQLTGPPAPSAPTLTISSTTSATVKIPKVSGLNSSQYYRAILYTTTDRSQYVARSADYNCNQDMQDTTMMSCSINTEGLVAPNQYVATGQVKNNSDIWSAESADSNIVTGISAGFTLSNPVSGLTTQGKARLVGDNVLGSLLNSTSRKVTSSPDGTGGLYIANRTATNELKIGRISGATSTLDNAFGSSGFVTVTVDGSVLSANTAGKIAWFGDAANRKWISTISTGNGQLFAEGSASTSTATATTIDVRTFCRSHFGNQQASGELRVYSAPTIRPLAMVNCSVWSMGTSDSRMILAKINSDGTLTELVNMTPQSANDFFAIWGNNEGGFDVPELANSVNLSATGSEVAIAIAIVNATYTEGNYNTNPPTESTMTAHSRVLWRVPANLGTPTSTPLSYTTNTNLMTMNGPTTEPIFRLQPFNNGTKMYAMVLKNATGCTYTQTPPIVENCNVPGASPRSLKLHEVNVASGTLNADASAKNLSGLSSTLTEFQAALPTSGTLLPFIVRSANSTCGIGGCTTTGGTYSPGVIDAATGTVVRGENVTYTIGGSPVNALWTNAAGKLQWLFTKQNATGHSIVEWQPSEISSTPVSVPTITGGAVGLSLNAGGSKIDITGTNLTLVTKVLFGTKEAKFTKTATKLTVTVPSGTAAGSVAVTVTYTGGQAAVPAGTWNYMGATKRAQTLTPTGLGDPTHSGASEANRNFSVASSVQGYPVTVVSKSPTVCTYVSGVVDFIGNGTCTLQASQAGDAVTAGVNATYEIYYESVVNASALYSTDAGKPTITLTGQGLGAVSKVMFGNVEVVPTKKTDTTITVKVPAAPTAGANVDVSLKYTNGTVVDTDLNFDFVGTTKLTQVVTLLAGFSQATYGDSARTLTASSATADLAATDLPGLPYVYTTSTSSVCAISADQLRFLGAGDCKVKATQAGNAGVNAAVSTEFTIVVAAKAQSITVDETPISITDVTGANLGATNSNGEVLLEYTSSDELICTVDGEGSVTGLSAGTCTIKINAPADSRYLAATEKSVTVTVTLSEVDAPADATDDIDATPIPIANGGANTFLELSDPSLQVSWDKANGKLTPRATGVYTGYIVAELKFTVAGVNYVCTNVFGTTSKLSNPVKPTAPAALGEGATAKQIAAFAKAQAAYVKALAAYKIAYAKTWGTKVFASKNFCADTNKIKNATAQNPFGTSFVTAVKAAKTTAEKKSEANALKALKNFTGSVTISVKRWRAWPTTMKNKTGNAGTGKTISATKKVNTLTLG